MDSCRQLEHEGFEVTYLPVGTNGRVDIEEFKDAIKPTTALASVMTVNNEIGVIQPIKELGEIQTSKINKMSNMQKMIAELLKTKKIPKADTGPQ